MRAAAIVARVLAQFQKLFNVEVPGFQIGADRALALAALVHCHRGVVDHFEEGHDTLALAVGALDVAAQGAHARPVVAQTAGELGQQRVLLDGLVDAVKVVRHGGEVAARELRTTGARIEQRGRARHEVKAGEQLVELDGARFAVDFVERQTHGHAHEKGLRQLDATAIFVHPRIGTIGEEITVVQRLQTQVIELQVALGLERGTQTGQVELPEPLVEQFELDTLLDAARKILGVALGHLLLRNVLVQRLAAHGVQQQARGDLGVVGVALDQGARGEDSGLVNLEHRHAVVQIAQSFRHDGGRLHIRTQIDAGGFNQAHQSGLIERFAQTAVEHMQHRSALLLLCSRFLLGPLLCAAFAVQHIGARHLVLASAHQREFDLVLNVFNMKGAAAGTATEQGAHDVFGQRIHCFAHAGRGRTLPALHGQKGLGHRHGDFARLKPDHGPVATDDLVV